MCGKKALTQHGLKRIGGGVVRCTPVMSSTNKAYSVTKSSVKKVTTESIVGLWDQGKKRPQKKLVMIKRQTDTEGTSETN